MNVLEIIVLVAFLLSVFVGYKKGFLKTVFSLVAWLIALVICNVATPLVADFLIEKTTIAAEIQNGIEEKMNETMAQAITNTEVGVLEVVLPETVNPFAVDITEFVDVTPLVESVMSIIAFLVVVIVTRILLWTISLLLGVATKLPMLGKLDKILGLISGGAIGLVWCWGILSVVSVITFTGGGAEWASYIAGSKLLTLLQENNMLLNYIMGIK